MCVSVRGRPGKQIPDPLFGYIEMKNLLLRSNAFLKYVRYLDGTFRKRVTVALAMTASNVRLIYAVCHQRLVIHFPCDHLRHIGVCFESRTRLGRKSWASAAAAPNYLPFRQFSRFNKCRREPFKDSFLTPCAHKKGMPMRSSDVRSDGAVNGMPACGFPSPVLPDKISELLSERHETGTFGRKNCFGSSSRPFDCRRRNRHT